MLQWIGALVSLACLVFINFILWKSLRANKDRIRKEGEADATAILHDEGVAKLINRRRAELIRQYTYESLTEAEARELYATLSPVWDDPQNPPDDRLSADILMRSIARQFHFGERLST